MPKKQLRNVIAVIIAFAMLAAACGEDEPTPTTAAPTTAAPTTAAPEAAPIRIGLVIPDFTQNELILALKTGAEDAAADAGVELLVTGSGSAQDLVAAIENYAAAGVDVIVYDTIDAQAISPAILALNDAGIPVVCTVACATEGVSVIEIGYDYRADMGRPLGDWLAAYEPAPAKLAFIDSNQADESIAAIYAGIEDGLEAGGLADVERVVSPPTNWDRAAGLDAARSLLTAHPDVDIIVGLHDLLAGATLTAMEELGYKDTVLTGLGGTCEGLMNILEGRQALTVIQPLYPAGYLAVEAAVRIANGETLDEDFIPIGMVVVDQAFAEGVLDGSEPAVVSGVDLKTALEAAAAGC